MGFPSPAMDYVEDRINLNTLFIDHPSATSLVEQGCVTYVVDSARTPRNGDMLYYEAFGDKGIGKLMGGCIITQEGESIEGEALEDVVVMGKVILTITQHYDWGNPTI